MENAPAQPVGVTGVAKLLVQRLLVIGENRIELLGVEVQEAHQRFMQVALLGLAMGVLGLMASLAFSAAMVVMLWEVSPLAALLGLTGCYGAGAVFIYWRLTVLLRDWELLPGTLGQLQKDCQCLQTSLD